MKVIEMTKTESIQIAHEYSMTLRNRIGDNLLKTILFGSRARKDHEEYSDFDFLLIVKNRDSKIRDQVVDAEIEMLNKYDFLFSSLIYESHEWEKEQRYPFGWNVLRDGIEV